MVPKVSRRKLKRSKKHIKRTVRHRIINPNLSLRSNIISTNIPQTPNTSVRSRIMQNFQNPLLPLALSQTPPNVNLDAINSMRNQNDTRQQQINDYKRAKDDELSRQKSLDKEYEQVQNDKKEAIKMYESEKKHRKILEQEKDFIEKQLQKAQSEKEQYDHLSDKIVEMNQKYAKLQNTYDLNKLKNDRDTLKATINELEFNIQQQQAELEKSDLYNEINSLKAKNKELDAKKKQVQKMSERYSGNKGLEELINIQRENNHKKYQTNLAEERLKILEENYNMELQLQSSLSKEDMDKINDEERKKLEGAIQENIRLHQAIKDNDSAYNLYNEQHNLLEAEKLKNIHLQNDLYKAQQQLNINDGTNINEELNNTITTNINNSKKIEQLNMLEKTRNENMKSLIELKKANTAANYYLTPESIDMQNKIIDIEKQTLNMLKKAEAYNDLSKAQQELWKSNIARSKAKYLLDNDDASAVSQVAFLENELAKYQNIDAQRSEELQKVIDSISVKQKIIPKENIQEFYENNPKYQSIYLNPGEIKNFPLEYLQDLNIALSNYMNKWTSD